MHLIVLLSPLLSATDIPSPSLLLPSPDRRPFAAQARHAACARAADASKRDRAIPTSHSDLQASKMSGLMPSAAEAQMYLVGTDSQEMNGNTAARTPDSPITSDSDEDATTLAPTPAPAASSSGGASPPKPLHGTKPHNDEEAELLNRARPRATSRASTRYMTAEDVTELHRQLSRVNSGRSGGTSGSVYNPESDNFELERYLQQVFRKREEAGLVGRDASVVFEDLCVDGLGSGVTFGETLGSLFAKPIELLRNFNAVRHPPTKHILQNFTGAIKPGEMLLVLGRPGSGCSSLLKTIANQTASFSDVRGERSYSGITPKEMLNHHAGDLAYLPEDDIHLPVLTVDQTL